MKKAISFPEIQRRFDSEWILVEDPETDESLNVKRGVVLCHSKNRDEVYRRAREIGPIHSAILYTGELPENTAIVL